MKKTFILIASALLIILFLYAAFSKLLIYNTFVEQLKASPMVGGYAKTLAWVVPELEILIACLIMIQRTRLVGLYAAFFLMLLFTVYVYAIPHFFDRAHQPCSCGGIISKLSWTGHFWFNLCFTFLAGIAVSIYPLTPKKEFAYK